MVVVGSVALGLTLGPGLTPGFAVDAPLPPAPVVGIGSESAASASAMSTGSDVVVDDATSPTEVTVAHPNGTFTRTVHAEPVRMETATGWKDISTDLISTVENGVKVLKPEMAPVNVSLGTAGTDVMAVLDDKQGHTITQSWPFGNLPAPVVSENMATYPNVLPGVDLVQLVHKTGVSQVLKIANAQAAADPRVGQMRIYLDTHNASVSTTPDGGLQAKGHDSGVIELRTAAGQWWDSSQTGASVVDPGGPGMTRPFKLSLGTEAGQQTQVFGMDQILKTPGIVYPIYVDPDWTTTRTSYVYVDSGYPSTSYWNGQYTTGTGHVGFLPAANTSPPDGMDHITRTYYQFSTSALAGKTILSARMNVLETWASSCTPRPVSAWITGPVSSSTTWNVQPGTVQKASTMNVAYGNENCGSSDTNVAFDMAAVKSRLATTAVWTVMLRTDDEADIFGWKVFSKDASMQVTYDTPPTTPSIWGITGGLWHTNSVTGVKTYVTRFNIPTFTVTASDPDGVNGGTIKVSFRVKNSSGGIVFQGQSPSGPAAAGTQFSRLSTVKFADGNYVLEAQSIDQQGASSPWMSFSFTVDTTAPPAPSISPVTASLKSGNNTDPNGVVGVTPYTLAITKGADTATRKSYDIEFVVYKLSSGTTDTYPADVGSWPCSPIKRVSNFVKVCGSTATITVAALEQQTFVYAWAFDTAGNSSEGPMTLSSPISTPSKYTFTVNGPIAPLPSTPLSLTLLGQAEMADIAAPNGNPAGCPTLVNPDVDPSTLQKEVRLSHLGDAAKTSSAAIDTAKSYSVGTWFCNTGSRESTYARHIVTQLAGPGSPAFALRLDKYGYLEAAQWTGMNGTGLQLQRISTAAVTPNTWYYVSMVYDKINGQLRYSITDNGYTGTWTVVQRDQTFISSPSTQPVILGPTGLAGDSNFYGEIFNPTLSNTVLSFAQFTGVRQQKNDSGVLWK